MSRAKTKKEVIDEFLETIYSIKEYWEKESRAETTKAKLEGCIFSILAMIDGSNANLPAMLISLDPHPSDKQFHKENNEDWFKPNQIINDEASLHNEWCRVRREHDEI